MLKRVEEGEDQVRPRAVGAVFAPGISRAQAQAIAADASARIKRHAQRLALSRGGLADVVSGLGEVAQGRAPGPDAVRDLMALFLGSSHAAGLMAARAARKARITIEQAEAAVPAVFVVELGKLARRAQPELARIYGLLPALNDSGAGTVHGDLTLLVRDGLGAGAIGGRALRRQVHAAIAEAADFGRSGSVGWYVGHAAAPVRRGIAMLRRAVMAPHA